MASKVNVKFVIGLAAAVIVLFAVVAYVGYSTVSKSAADHAAEAEAFEAKGNFEKAAESWSRAVNKNRTNPEMLKRWFTALSKTTPDGSERYRRTYREGYNLALQGWADAAPTDVAVQRRLLDLLLAEVRMQPNAAAGWEFLLNRSESAVRAFPESDPNRDIMRRYLGIARTYRLTNSSEPDDENLAKAEADLQAALAADPNDALTAAAYIDWHRINILRERSRGSTEKAAEFVKRGREFMASYLAKAEIKLPVLLNEIQFELNERVATADRNATNEQIVKGQYDRIGAMLDQILVEPIDRLDRPLTWSAVKLAIGTGYPEAAAKGEKIFERLLTSDPNDVLTLFNRGEVELALAQNERAMATYEQLAQMKDLPLSQAGMLLFDLRVEARARKADAALALWQKSTDEAGRTKWLDETRRLVKEYVEAAGPSTSRGQLLSAKIKFAENDLAEARKLLGQYLEQLNPPRSDASALKLLAEVLRRQQSLGGARDQLEQVLRMNPADTDALAALADIESGLNNLDGAQQRVERLLAVNPNNERAKARLEELKQVRAGAKSQDPVIRLMSQLGELMQKSPPDFDGARKLAVEAADTVELTPRMTRALANRLVMFDESAKAKTVLERGLAKNPDDAGLKADLAAMTATDPLKARLEAIESSAVPDLIKAMMRFQVYNAAGQNQQADEQFKLAASIDPNHPLIVGVLFDRAILEGNKPEARRLAELATTKNLDRVGGLIFRTRLELSEGRLAEAAGLAQQAVDGDPLNPIPWRLLGAVRLQRGQFAEGITALEKAVAIKPNDIDSLKGLIRARINAGQRERALVDAREAVKLAGNDEEVADMWLTLEGEVEGGDRAKAVEIRKRQFERNPNDVTNLTELVQLLIRMDRYDEAGKALEALKSKRNDLATVQLEALWFFGRGDVKKAIDVVQSHIDALPSEQRTMAMLVGQARFLSEIGQLEAGLAVLAKARDMQSKESMEIDREIGDMTFASGRFAEAAEAYGRALANVAKDEDNRLALRTAECLNKLGKFKEADEVAAKINPGASAGQQQAVLLLRAEAAEGLKDRAKAGDLLNRAIAADTSSALGYFKRAIFLGAEESTRRDAIADLEQALRARPEFFQARIALADVLLNQREEDRAVALLREGLAKEPRNAALRERLYQTMVATGRPAEAVTLLDEARQKFPDPRWILYSAQLAERMNEFEKAVGFYGEAWEMIKSPEIATRYADGLVRLPKPDLAKAKAVLAEPEAGTDKFFPLLLTRAQIARAERRPADAEKDVKAAFALVDQTNADQLQVFFQSIRSLAPGAEIFTLVDRLKPADGFGPLATLQVVRLKIIDAGKRAEGLRELDAVLADSRDKDRVQAGVRTIADLLYFERSYDAAAEVYTRLLAVRPNDDQLQNNLAYTLSKHLNQHEKALPLAEAATQAQSANPNALDTLGSIQLALGKLTEAEQTLKKALAVAPQPRDQVPVLLHLAEVKLAQGDRSGAEEQFEQAQRAMVRDPRVRPLFEEETKRVENKLRGR
jgi:tetratricopeptide (TPR) repeat protein